MVKLYIWIEGSWARGIVASENDAIEFKYSTDYSQTGITVRHKPSIHAFEQALLHGVLTEPTTIFQQFLVTFPADGLWRCYADGSWLNHE
jgi:hypothetical protein